MTVTHRRGTTLWTNRLRHQEDGPSAHACTAAAIASPIATAASTVGRTGARRHSTAGMRVSRRIGRRIPHGGATSSPHDDRLADTLAANERPPTDTKAGTR